jgi:hypothetical protein
MVLAVRLPFPTRISYKGACTFAVVLTIAQLLEKTAPLFALCSFLFIMIATAAFNQAEGFSSTSGAYVFFYATLGVILGLCVKVVIGQPADSNLLVPQRDILVYLVSICAMYASLFISRKLTLRKPLLQNLISDHSLLDSAVGCMIAGVLISLLLTLTPRSDGSVLSALNQVNKFLPMSIILGTIYQIRKSGGRSSINAVVLFAGSANLVMGLLSFSKEGIFTSFVCWLLAASSQRYRLSRLQVVGLIVGALLMSRYLVPYSQYGRGYEQPANSGYDNAIYLLSHLSEVRELYEANQQEALQEAQSYFGSDLGFLERLQMIGPDDALIAVTEEHGQFGLLPVYAGFGNLVPHFIWPDKPVLYFGNQYAHEIGGMIAEDDVSTGISFSPSGEGYHLLRWYGIILVAPILWIMLFTIFDSLCGNTLLAPWGLLAMVVFAHQAPEGMLSGVIYCMGFVSFSIIVAALASAYLMPILGGLVKGPGRGKIVQQQETVMGSRRALVAPEPGQ